MIKISIFIFFIILKINANSLVLKTDKFCNLHPQPDVAKLEKLYSTELYKEFYNVLRLKKFPIKIIPIMFCIAKLESNFNINALNVNKNGTKDKGLFQINDVWKDKCKYYDRIHDLESNIDCALLVLKSQGLNAWVTYQNFGKTCEKAIYNHELKIQQKK